MLDKRKPLKKLASCALCCLAAAAALAGPPSGNGSGGLLGRASGILGATASRTPASHLGFQGFQKLDLRPPEALPGARASAPIGDSAAAFPSSKHAQFANAAGAEEESLAGGNWAALRMESKVHEMERRVPHEGLPVARLWETKTALLHVGLSPRGKPGLWLIQKVP